MERYEFFYWDTLIGILTVDPQSNLYAYEVDEAGLAKVIDRACLDRVMREGSNGFVKPIPFFQSRLYYMKKYDLQVINYQTDPFVLRRIADA